MKENSEFNANPVWIEENFDTIFRELELYDEILGADWKVNYNNLEVCFNFSLESWKEKTLKYLNQFVIETKIGCSGKCLFCNDPSIKGSEVQLRRNSNVIAEIDTLLSNDITNFFFSDSEFNLCLDETIGFLGELLSGINPHKSKLRWESYLFPFKNQDKKKISTMFRLMSATGAYRVTVTGLTEHGFEKLTQGQGDIETLKFFAGEALKNGIEPVISLLVGNDNLEALKSFFQILESFEKEINMEISLFIH